MSIAPGHGAGPSWWTAKRRAAAWWTAAVAVCVWCGCAVTKDNYATLSFFFDGVPDPSGKVVDAAGNTKEKVVVVVHPPFAAEKCELCHKSKYRPSRNDPTPCLECHAPILEEHAWTHGAVAGGACVWCHNPHEAGRKWLIRGADRKVCGQCHAASMTEKSPVPAHSQATGACLDCHFGHGGQNSLMLRAGATAQGPPPPDSEQAAPAKEGHAEITATMPADPQAPKVAPDPVGTPPSPEAGTPGEPGGNPPSPEATPKPEPGAGPKPDEAPKPDAAPKADPKSGPDTVPKPEPGAAPKPGDGAPPTPAEGAPAPSSPSHPNSPGDAGPKPAEPSQPK